MNVREVRLRVALKLSKSLNSGVESIYQWVTVCDAVADEICDSPAEKDKFLTVCGFDEVIGHYDWREEFECK